MLTGEPGADPHQSGLPADFFTQAADAIAASLPHARRQTLNGQGHVADPAVLTATLTPFLSA